MIGSSSSSSDAFEAVAFLAGSPNRVAVLDALTGLGPCSGPDFVVRFKADASGLVPGDTLAVLVGDLVDGTELRGTDPVTVDAPGPG